MVCILDTSIYIYIYIYICSYIVCVDSVCNMNIWCVSRNNIQHVVGHTGEPTFFLDFEWSGERLGKVLLWNVKTNTWTLYVYDIASTAQFWEIVDFVYVYIPPQSIRSYGYPPWWWGEKATSLHPFLFHSPHWPFSLHTNIDNN